MAATIEKIFDCQCRTCMQELGEESSNGADPAPELKWQYIYETIEECGAVSISELIVCTVPQIEVHLNDGLAKKICHKCMQQLLSMYRFQQMCIQSDQQMRQLIAKLNDDLKMARNEDETVITTVLFEKEQRIDFEPGNTLTEIATKASAGDPLDDMDYVKTEPFQDEPIALHIEVELLHATDSPINELPTKSANNEESDKKHSNIVCDICEQTFCRPYSLKRHKMNMHSYHQQSCEVCNETFYTLSSLAKHRRRSHSIPTPKKEPKQYTCKFCQKICTRSDLKAHERTHTGERPYLCPECGKGFTQAGNLEQHILRHGDNKAYECPYCPLRFRCRNDVAKHKVIHKNTKRYVCDVCGSRFKKASELVIHKKYHNNEKPYKCDCCEMRFTRMTSQRRHMRTHTGEKPYKCKYCERAFAQSNDHIKHLRTHLGDNVYRCELCPLAFRLASEVRLHFATHKNEDPETRERNMKALKEVEAKLQSTTTGTSQTSEKQSKPKIIVESDTK